MSNHVLQRGAMPMTNVPQIFGLSPAAMERYLQHRNSGRPHGQRPRPNPAIRDIGKRDASGFVTVAAHGTADAGFTIRVRESREPNLEIRARVARLGLSQNPRRDALANRIAAVECVDIDAMRRQAQSSDDAIAERIERLGIDTDPNSIANQIRQQIATQPAGDRDHLKRLFGIWQIGNQMFFDGKLKLPQIVLDSQSKMGTAAASCSRFRSPTLLKFRRDIVASASEEFVRGCVYHEMAHQYLGEGGCDDLLNDGHHARFGAVCNEIGKALGVDMATCANHAARWPDH